MPKDGPAFLDRPAARLLAALVLILCAGLLTMIHREDWRAVERAGEAGSAAGDGADPAAACIEQRFADIDAMVDEGFADSAQAALFRQRAEAMCRATVEDDSRTMPSPAE